MVAVGGAGAGVRAYAHKVAKDAIRGIALKDVWELPGRPRGRALLSYIVHPLLPPRCLRDRVMFSNRGLAQEWVRALNRLGLSVDVVNFDNDAWLPRRGYDVFVGHGGVNFSRIADGLEPGTIRIYFATGLHQGVQNARAARRSTELRERRGVDLPPDRLVGGDEPAAYARADAIICLGNAAVAASFSPHPTVFHVNNAVFPPRTGAGVSRSWSSARREFLFFAGRGNLHKGLDLLLEAFAGQSLLLHVCQHLQPEFAASYRQELSEESIRVHGFVPMRSPTFLELASRCAWIVLPSCAEGQPGSVLEGMARGLVPILPDSAGLDVAPLGIRIETLTVAGVTSALQRAVALPEEQVARLSARAIEVTRTVYSVGRFRRELLAVLRSVVGSRRHGAGPLGQSL